MSDTKKVKRVYGKETTIGDIILNKETNSIFFSIEMGFMGRKTINLVKNESGQYDMFGSYMTKETNEPIMFSIGKTFQVQDKEKNIVDGLTQGKISLSTTYSKELEKNIFSDENALFITTHQLKEEKKINDSLVKIGWVVGQLGIAIDED
jgi:hypothetical protein